MLRKDCKTHRDIHVWAEAKLKQFQNRGELKTPQFRRFIKINHRYLDGYYCPESGVYVGTKLKACIDQKVKLILSELNKIENELRKTI